MTLDNRFLRGIATLVACVVLGTAASGYAQTKEGQLELLETPETMPDIIYYDAEGKGKTLSSHRGKVVVLHFWAKWCPPCVVELPEMKTALEALAHDDLLLLPISLDFKVETVQQFYAENNIDFPVMMDNKSAAMRTAGIRGLPGTVIVDREGRIISRHNGVANWASEDTQALIRNALVAR